MIKINKDNSVDLDEICNKHYEYAKEKVVSKILDTTNKKKVNDIINYTYFKKLVRISIEKEKKFNDDIKKLDKSIVELELLKLNKNITQLKLSNLEDKKKNKFKYIIGEYLKINNELFKNEVDSFLEYLKGKKVQKLNDLKNLSDNLKYLKNIIADIQSEYKRKKLKIDDVIKTKYHIKYVEYFTWLKLEHKKIITGKTYELKMLIDDYESSFFLIKSIVLLENHLPKKEAKLIKELNRIFNYDNFVGGEIYKNGYWSAYELLKELNIRVCPYCNRQYITLYESYNGKTRADLDHFLPKSKYPYLALSFYNLVPSCKICNSSLKLDKEFSYYTHLNPYENGFENELLFTMNFKKKEIKKVKAINKNNNNTRFEKVNKTFFKDIYDIDFLFGNSDNFEIGFKQNISTQADASKIRKAKGNVEVFKLKELYNNHKDHIQELIKKALIYNESRINELFNDYGGTLFSSKEEIIKIVVANYIEEKDLDKRVLSKLIRDISKEFGIC